MSMSEYDQPQLLSTTAATATTAVAANSSTTTTGSTSSDPQLLIGIPDANGFISTPRDSDVLCGRGGAALRHPGNQTYRRLVNLNKGLYITCLKTEKLKISRSIVAAIREQNGRFLEKNATDDQWYDIGDKKAIEKTSQALREGQPKLRQRIVEMGTTQGNGVGGGGSSSNNHHHGHTMPIGAPQYGENHEILIHGIDHPNQHSHHQHQQQHHTPQYDPATNAILQQQQKLLQMNLTNNPSATSNSSGNVANTMTSDEIPSSSSMLQLLGSNSNNNTNMSSLSMNQNNNTNNGSNINTSQNDFNTEYLLHRLSLHDLNQSGNIASLNLNSTASNATGSSNNMNTSSSNNNAFQAQQQILQQQQQLLQQQQQILYNQQQQQQQQRNTQSNATRASVARELGISESQLSIMSDFSLFGNSNNNNNINSSNIGSFITGMGTNTNMNDSMYSMLLNGSTNMSTGTFNPHNMSQITSGGGGGLTNATSNGDLQQQLMNLDSFRNSSLMGLPISSFHMTTSSNHDNSVPLPPPSNIGVSMNEIEHRNLNQNSMPQQQQQQYNSNIVANETLIQQQQLQLQQQQQFVQPTPTQQQKRQLSSSSITTGTAVATNPASMHEKQNFDRRRVFAKMKYVRPPSVQHVSGGGTGASTTNIPSVVAVAGDSTVEDTAPSLQQQQHPSSATPTMSINTIGTMTTATTVGNNNTTIDDQLPDFHFVESNAGMETSTMSFFSTISNTMPSTSNSNSNTGVGVTSASGIQPHHHQQQQQQLPNTANNNGNVTTTATIPSYDQQIYMLQKQQEQLLNVSNDLTSSNTNSNSNNSRMNPPGAITIDTGYSKVVVETAKIVDKSSGRLNHASGGSNNMLHNGNNYDAMSIGSRMSMMSGLSRISDGNENDSIFSDLSKKIGNVSTRSMAMSEMSALEIQELNDEDDADESEDQQRHEHHHDIDVSSSATLTMDDDFSK